MAGHALLRAPPCTTSSRGRSPFPPSSVVAAARSKSRQQQQQQQQQSDQQNEHNENHSDDSAVLSSSSQSSSQQSSRAPTPERLARRRVSWHERSRTGQDEITTSAETSAAARTSDTQQPHTLASPLHRRKPAAMSSGARDPTATGAAGADETTAILRDERGRVERRNYNTTQSPAASSSAAAAADEHATQAQQALQDASDRTTRQSAGRKRWLPSLTERYGSIELENRGSVARDHLALERTFLAWLRTSLSFASIGIAVTQLFRLNTSLGADKDGASVHEQRLALHHVGRPLGATFLGIGILVLAIGFHRYFESQHFVIMGRFPASRGSIMLVSGVAGALIVASLAVILAVAPAAAAAAPGHG